jgi:hypothetical protein
VEICIKTKGICAQAGFKRGSLKGTKQAPIKGYGIDVVELVGIEPTASSLRTTRSPS